MFHLPLGSQVVLTMVKGTPDDKGPGVGRESRSEKNGRRYCLRETLQPASALAGLLPLSRDGGVYPTAIVTCWIQRHFSFKAAKARLDL